MAERLARMYGTEEDKVNCPFYFKIGACRYGDKCLRIHNRPPYSRTLLIRNMYSNLPVELALSSGNQISEEDAGKAIKHFEDFYEEVFLELANYGEVDDLVVSDNIGEHLIGNVYVKFACESDAIKCMESIRNRYYDGKLIIPEYCPVTDFSNAKCKQFIEGSCQRGGYCNYMHLKPVSKTLKKKVSKLMYTEHPEYKKRGRDRSRSKEREHRHRRHHSRSAGSRSRDEGDQRMESEERRAMIQRWNEDGVDDEAPDEGRAKESKKSEVEKSSSHKKREHSSRHDKKRRDRTHSSSRDSHHRKSSRSVSVEKHPQSEKTDQDLQYEIDNLKSQLKDSKDLKQLILLGKIKNLE